MCIGLISTFAGGGSPGGSASGNINGVGFTALFYLPYDIAIDTTGVQYIADYGNHLIRTISPAGNYDSTINEQLSSDRTR